jgi:sporulation protein YlmC with PRC-barrel domain
MNTRTLRTRPLHLLREVLDHEIVDADGVPCGRVDDIELDWTPNGPGVVALLLGPGAWVPRLPRPWRGAARWLFGRARVRIPWAEVEEVSTVVRLRSRAEQWGAGALDRRCGRWLARLPTT